ncbi:hypothetical protein TrST_g11641 [Triparma strigata]|uniref:Acyl-CoA thioesterase II n=1 Tax=Triparma strigata TaxID=1606541 RepID=A0A9W7EPD2_9STRA|nr:hypothetical protein TrST_g11641 [Triparma strigata]
MVLSLAERTAALVRHVNVEQILRRTNSGIYLGRSVDLGWGRVYGGQTMAQALSAAQQLAGPERRVHQFGCHFLRPGDAKEDVEFEADKLADGNSFGVMHVRAMQKGKVILSLTASLQTPEEGLEHSYQHRFTRDGAESALRPEWKRPEDCKSVFDHMQPYLKQIPKSLRPLYEIQQPLEVRPAEFTPPWDATPRQPVRANWIKSRLPLPDDHNVHERLLSYISDWGLLETSLFPHPVGMWSPGIQAASLSHNIVFHRPFRMDQWLCHAMYSPTSTGGRGYALGEFWSEDGELIASTSQEGLIRHSPPEQDAKL